MLWPCRPFAALLLGLQPGVLTDHPQPPLLLGIWGALPTHSQSAPPSWQQTLGFPAMPSQWPRGPVYYQSECPAGCQGKGGTDLVRLQGYGVNGALCPFKWSLSWAKEMGDREAYHPDPDLASPRLWWSWALGCGRQAPFFPELSGSLSQLK